jgi:hypothetical protein
MNMSRWVRSVTVLVGASAALFGGADAVAHQPLARAAANCGVGQGKGYGYAYLISLSVHGIGCANGKSVVKQRGQGWSCSKKRLQTSSVAYTDRESCSKGSRRVQWTFQQNT